MKKVAVIGGGLGGIASAIRFKARGYDVSVYERLNELGGRAQKFSKDGYLHDAGPTVITAPYLFTELFGLFNENIDNYVNFQPLDPWYRFHFNDGTEFDYGPDRNKMLERIHQISPNDVDGYLMMLKRAETIFEIGYEKLASEPFNKFFKMLRYGPDIIRLGGYKSVYSFVSKYLEHPNLRQAFSIQPLLVGGNPFTTSSIYALIHALEQKWGISFVMGGTNHLVTELRKLMERHDIKIYLQHDVDEFITNKNSVKSIKFLNGKEVEADIVVSNADPIQVNSEFLKKSKISWHNQLLKKYAKHSMGLFVLFFGSKKQYNNVAHHTIWMGPRYKELLKDIFDKHHLAEDFSIYLHRPTATDPSFAPEGHDSYYALVPVPNLKGNYNWDEIKKDFSEKILTSLDKTIMPGILTNAVSKFCMTPVDFKNDYRTPHGSGFSIAPILTQSAWFRTHNQDDKYKNLYYVGAGTHPGAGIPGVLNSAKVVDNIIHS
jgi:phytoene desaturase|tara:strand:+ start:2403 stop:3869 length:1467 start_codon:yes stop_codon:yes gene_type:complete